MQGNAGVFVNVYLNLAETFAFFFLRFTFALHFNRKKQSMMNLFRKAITFFFLLLASVTMLAFTVVPHHHHEAYICFNSRHCCEDMPVLPHTHDQNENGESSCVSHLFQTQVGRSQSAEEEEGYSPAQANGLPFFLPPCPPALKLLFQTQATRSPIPYEESLHTVTLCDNKAGRAPPALH